MKSAFGILWGVLLFATGAVGQGTINFATRVTGQVDAPVSGGTPWGTAGLDGSWVGQLYAGPPGGAVSAVGTPVPFRTGTGQGYITAGGKVVVPGIPGGSLAVVELRVWKSSLGATYEAAFAAGGGCSLGRSAPITITLGGGGVPPSPDAHLVGLQGFLADCLPEPTATVLGALGLVMLILRRSGTRGGA